MFIGKIFLENVRAWVEAVKNLNLRQRCGAGAVRRACQVFSTCSQQFAESSSNLLRICFVFANYNRKATN